VPLEVVERLQLLVVSCEGLRVGLSDGGDGAQLENCPGEGDELGRCGGSRDQGILQEKGALGFAEEAVGGIQLLVLQSILELWDDCLEIGHGGELEKGQYWREMVTLSNQRKPNDCSSEQEDIGMLSRMMRVGEGHDGAAVSGQLRCT